MKKIHGCDVATLDASLIAQEYSVEGETIVIVIVADARGLERYHEVAVGYHGPESARLPILRLVVADLEADQARRSRNTH